MNDHKKIVIIGPAHPLRGGLASYNERLAREFQLQGHEVIFYTFSLQYPGFIFPGATQYSSEPVPTDLSIKIKINSINPLNWFSVGNEIKKLNPDIIVVRYWLPLMGPCLGTILRRVKKNKHTKIVCIADNIVPHEKRTGDKPFTNYFLKSVDACITMSEKVLSDLRLFDKTKPAQLVPHPLYDNFGEKISKEEARKKLGIGKEELVILFFGFIRKYKGLGILLDAMKILKTQIQNSIPNLRDQIPKLLVAGEFYEDEKPYLRQIKENNLENVVILKTQFIPDSQVKYYLCAADCVVQPYRNATQSGVTPLAYHFEKPMIVTNVGGLPALVPNEKAGLVAEPNAQSIAEAIMRYFQLGENFFLPHLRIEKEKYKWSRITEAIFQLSNDIQK